MPLSAQKAAQRRWYAANRDHVREYGRAYREENRDQVLAAQQRWRDSNREHIADYSRRTYDRDRHREWWQRWLDENPEGREAQRERERKRQADVNARATVGGEFSEGETSFIVREYGHLTFAEMALALGRSHTSVRKKVERMRRYGLLT